MHLLLLGLQKSRPSYGSVCGQPSPCIGGGGYMLLEYGVSVYGPKAGMYVTGGRVLARVPGLGSLAHQHHNPYGFTGNPHLRFSL